MLQVVSFIASAAILYTAVAVIVATIKAELPYILRALGIDPATQSTLHENRAPRVRVTRPLRGSATLAAGRPAMRAAA